MSQGTQSTSCPACGKGLRWKAELVGRKVKCSCGEVFAMPVGPGGVGPASAAAPSAPPVAAAPKVSPFDPDTFELSDPVVGHGAAGGGKCPSCGAAMKAGAVLCVISTDPGIQLDMPMWCKATRNEHLATVREGEVFRSFVRKGGR